MSFKNRAEFIRAQASEKIALAQVDARARLYVFTGPVDNIYSKQVNRFVVDLKQDDTALTKASSALAITEGSFFYNIDTGLLSVRLIGDADPKLVELIGTYRLFFADKTIALPHDLQDISKDVMYDGRIVTTPGYNHKIGIDQALTSLVGEGTLHLKNHDGGLDTVFDRLIFENQAVTIYSWNPDLKPSEARVIYRGRTTNKTFDGIDVKLKIKDEIFALLDSPALESYKESDNVTESALGQFKRRIYGRVDGLRCQSVDQVGAGVPITGTVSIQAESNILTGNGTLFLTELSQGDQLTIGLDEVTVERVVSNTQIELDNEVEFTATNQPATLIPERGITYKNRTFLAAGHICAEVTHNIVNALQFNRLQLDSTAGLFAGDFLEINDTSERIQIKTVAPDNIIVLRQNMVTLPAVATTVTRQPIQDVFVSGRKINADDFNINNGSSCGFTLQDDVEFNLARPRLSKFIGTFTNGSRTVSVAANDIQLSEIFQAGDWIKPNNLTYTTYYKVINVNDSTLELATAFADPNDVEIIQYKSPDYITDDTIISCNILGKTVDGTATGAWINNVAQAQRDLLEDIGINTYNAASFTEGELDSPQLISMAIPEDFTAKTLPKTKDIVDKFSKSTHSSLTLDNDLRIKFKTLNVVSGQALPVIRDFDVINWKIQSTNGKTFKRVYSTYRLTDVDNSTLESGNKTVDYSSEFVSRYIETNKVDNLSLYLYKQRDAEIASHRHIYYNRLGVATLTIQTDLRLENIEIGEVVIADFKRLYVRYGSAAHRKKLMLVIGKTLNGERTELILSDLGNTFNTSSFITENDAVEYNLATEDEKIINGYITDNQGIVDDNEDTAGVHLIS